MSDPIRVTPDSTPLSAEERKRIVEQAYDDFETRLSGMFARYRAINSAAWEEYALGVEQAGKQLTAALSVAWPDIESADMVGAPAAEAAFIREADRDAAAFHTAIEPVRT